ncbi:MAG TPA: antibiotic biosynthesis monooxygenase [Ramlibacter sp.]|nr:antibiotic biosynthesis monooxygenase [Ramlibacter sp.]
MILEIADIRVTPGKHEEFKEAIERALVTVAVRAKGMKGYKVNHCIETPERFILQIFWETLEDHTVGFRKGPLFTEWRAIIGQYFAQPPLVEHFTLVTKSD